MKKTIISAVVFARDSAQMPAWKARMDFWTVTLSSPPEHLLRALGAGTSTEREISLTP
jgi:hypothetical protein